MPVVRSPISVQKKYTRPSQVKTTIGLREFYNKRKKVLISRNCGGLGDILMHRMLFEDFKLLLPNVEIHFACPPMYHDSVSDHPFIDKILDSNTVNYHDYIIHYNTSTACGRWEMAMAPMSGKHRSDIWANHCGIDLTKHDMHFRISSEEQQEGLDLIEKHRDRPGKAVLIAPISAMHNKNMSDDLLLGVVAGLRDRGYFPFGLHVLLKNDIPTIHSLKLRQVLSATHQSDYIVSVDTSHFHAAGGMHKPVVGVFTFANGKTYGCYYPNVELVQGPCPLKYSGCYDWGQCPAKHVKIPCCSGLSTISILAAFDKLAERMNDATS